MRIFYSDSPLKLDLYEWSIFLAGPTPRSTDVPSWRPEAIAILESLGYDGQVIIPEHEFSKKRLCGQKLSQEEFDRRYLTQVEWENEGTEKCSRVVFWIPRKLDTMPAFTTNVEFGRYVKSDKIVYGRPPESQKNLYLDWLYKKFNDLPIHENLTDLLKASIRTRQISSNCSCLDTSCRSFDNVNRIVICKKCGKIVKDWYL